MANRYWVGGSASWDGTAGTKWAATSGGAGGQTVPTTADDVFFDASSTGTVVIAAGNTGAKSITCTGFTGTLGGSASITVAGNVTLVSGMTFSYLGTMTFTATATIVSASKTFCPISVNGPGITVTQGDALNLSSNTFDLTEGTFNTANYNLTFGSININLLNAVTLTLGSSTVTTSATSFAPPAPGGSFTLNRGTSQINLTSGSSITFNGSGNTFYNVAFTATASSVTRAVNGSNTFNNLSFTAPTTAGFSSTASFGADQTISGTLTVSGGTDARNRVVMQSDNTSVARTLTCAAVSLTDVDFENITIAGAAAPATGTRLGDRKGNSGISFTAAKTVYFNNGAAGNASWMGVSWCTSSGGTPAANNFPLPQDTAVIDNAGAVGSTNAMNFPGAGVNIGIGTIDMSGRTTAVTLNINATSLNVYGNWINGSGTAFSGTQSVFFTGRGAQSITSSGKTFTTSLHINSPGGTVTLQDAFTTDRSSSPAIRLITGTFNANGYNVTMSGAAATLTFSSSSGRTLNFGSGTWSIAGSGTVVDAGSATGLTVSGSGTISLTSASSKTFQGRDVQTWPTLNQGGAGQLTIAGNNKFANITNTYKATGATTVLFTAGTTNEFTAFSLSGEATRLCTLGSTTTASATLKKSTRWFMGANSTNGGNNQNLTFTAGDGIDYLSVSYITGLPGLSGGNFLMFFN